MITEEQRNHARRSFETIRDERGRYANTATRIGNALLLLLDLFGDGGSFLSKDKEDTTRYLLSLLGGAIIDLYLQSPEYEPGEEGKGFKMWKDPETKKWILEIDKLRLREVLELAEASIDKFINQPTFLKGLISLGNIILGNYAEGVEGGILRPDGSAELKALIVRELAKLGELFVSGDSVFGGNLSSPEFISDFLGGKGWSIQKKTVINAAGVEEERYFFEIDHVTIRGTLRVYEMIVSQLLGENDNRVFTAMMEVDSLEYAGFGSGKIWLNTKGGKLYNPFREGDYIMVQRYNPAGDVVSGGDGYVVKLYEMIIDGVGSGGRTDENGDRLDWVTFRNFTPSDGESTPEQLIAKGDTLVRVDNDRDPERKGIVTVMTVGPNTPYMDVIYGLKTNPVDALKSRIGNLQGIRTELFGWLEGFGAYINNLYAVGLFRNAQTGESLNARIEATRRKLSSLYEETTFNIPDEDNFITNGQFQKDLEGWTVTKADGSPVDDTQETGPVGTGSMPLLFNGQLLAYQSRLTAKVEGYEGIRMLHLLNRGIVQDFSLLKENGKHDVLNEDEVSGSTSEEDATATTEVPDTLYMGIRILPLTSGTLKFMFVKSDGSVSGVEKTISSARTWQLIQAKDEVAAPWDYEGEGHLLISYTGECRIRFVALQTDPIVNSRLQYSTLIEQNARRILMEARKRQAGEAELLARIILEAENIMQVVTDNEEAMEEAIEERKRDLEDYINENDPKVAANASWITVNKKYIDIVAASFDEQGNLIYYATRLQTSKMIEDSVRDLAKAADVELLDSKIDSDISRISGLITTLDQSIKDESDQNDQRALALATWQQQTSDRILAIAGKWDATTGELIGYSTTLQTAEAIRNAVKDLAKAADVNALDEKIDTDIANISNDLTALDNKIKAESDENDQRAVALAAWQQTTSGSIQAIAAKWDATTGELIGYATRTETADMISDAVTGLAKASDVEAMRQNINRDLGDIQDDVDAVNRSVRQNADNIGGLASRVTQTESDITSILAKWDANGNLKGYSTSTQTAERIAAAVCEVGNDSSNLLDCTDFIESDMDGWLLKEGVVTSVKYDGYNSFRLQFPTSGYRSLQQLVWDGDTVMKVLPGKWYTLSFWMYGGGSIKTLLHSGGIEGEDGVDTTVMGLVDNVEQTIPADGELTWYTTSNIWKRHTVTFKTAASFSQPRYLEFRMLTTGNIVFIACPRLEVGEVAHSYKYVGFKETGYDIQSGKFRIKADDFTLVNTSGDENMGVDENGNVRFRGTISGVHYDFKVYFYSRTNDKNIPLDADYYVCGYYQDNVFLPFAGSVPGSQVIITNPRDRSSAWDMSLIARNVSGEGYDPLIPLDGDEAQTSGSGYYIGKTKRLMMWADPSVNKWRILEETPY